MTSGKPSLAAFGLMFALAAATAGCSNGDHPPQIAVTKASGDSIDAIAVTGRVALTDGCVHLVNTGGDTRGLAMRSGEVTWDQSSETLTYLGSPPITVSVGADIFVGGSDRLRTFDDFDWVNEHNCPQEWKYLEVHSLGSLN